MAPARKGVLAADPTPPASHVFTRWRKRHFQLSTSPSRVLNAAYVNAMPDASETSDSTASDSLEFDAIAAAPIAVPPRKRLQPATAQPQPPPKRHKRPVAGAQIRNRRVQKACPPTAAVQAVSPSSIVARKRPSRRVSPVTPPAVRSAKKRLPSTPSPTRRRALAAREAPAGSGMAMRSGAVKKTLDGAKPPSSTLQLLRRIQAAAPALQAPKKRAVKLLADAPDRGMAMRSGAVKQPLAPSRSPARQPPSKRKLAHAASLASLSAPVKPQTDDAQYRSPAQLESKLATRALPTVNRSTATVIYAAAQDMPSQRISPLTPTLLQLPATSPFAKSTTAATISAAVQGRPHDVVPNPISALPMPKRDIRMPKCTVAPTHVLEDQARRVSVSHSQSASKLKTVVLPDTSPPQPTVGVLQAPLVSAGPMSVDSPVTASAEQETHQLSSPIPCQPSPSSFMVKPNGAISRSGSSVDQSPSSAPQPPSLPPPARHFPTRQASSMQTNDAQNVFFANAEGQPASAAPRASQFVTYPSMAWQNDFVTEFGEERTHSQCTSPSTPPTTHPPSNSVTQMPTNARVQFNARGRPAQPVSAFPAPYSQPNSNNIMSMPTAAGINYTSRTAQSPSSNHVSSLQNSTGTNSMDDRQVHPWSSFPSRSQITPNNGSLDNHQAVLKNGTHIVQPQHSSLYVPPAPQPTANSTVPVSWGTRTNYATHPMRIPSGTLSPSHLAPNVVNSMPSGTVTDASYANQIRQVPLYPSAQQPAMNQAVSMSRSRTDYPTNLLVTHEVSKDNNSRPPIPPRLPLPSGIGMLYGTEFPVSQVAPVSQQHAENHTRPMPGDTTGNFSDDGNPMQSISAVPQSSRDVSERAMSIPSGTGVRYAPYDSLQQYPQLQTSIPPLSHNRDSAMSHSMMTNLKTGRIEVQHFAPQSKPSPAMSIQNITQADDVKQGDRTQIARPKTSYPLQPTSNRVYMTSDAAVAHYRGSTSQAPPSHLQSTHIPQSSNNAGKNFTALESGKQYVLGSGIAPAPHYVPESSALLSSNANASFGGLEGEMQRASSSATYASQYAPRHPAVINNAANFLAHGNQKRPPDARGPYAAYYPVQPQISGSAVNEIGRYCPRQNHLQQPSFLGSAPAPQFTSQYTLPRGNNGSQGNLQLQHAVSNGIGYTARSIAHSGSIGYGVQGDHLQYSTVSVTTPQYAGNAGRPTRNSVDSSYGTQGNQLQHAHGANRFPPSHSSDYRSSVLNGPITNSGTDVLNVQQKTGVPVTSQSTPNVARTMRNREQVNYFKDGNQARATLPLPAASYVPRDRAMISLGASRQRAQPSLPSKMARNTSKQPRPARGVAYPATQGNQTQYLTSVPPPTPQRPLIQTVPSNLATNSRTSGLRTSRPQMIPPAQHTSNFASPKTGNYSAHGSLSQHVLVPSFSSALQSAQNEQTTESSRILKQDYAVRSGRVEQVPLATHTRPPQSPKLLQSNSGANYGSHANQIQLPSSLPSPTPHESQNRVLSAPSNQGSSSMTQRGNALHLSPKMTVAQQPSIKRAKSNSNRRNISSSAQGRITPSPTPGKNLNTARSNDIQPRSANAVSQARPASGFPIRERHRIAVPNAPSTGVNSSTGMESKPRENQSSRVTTITPSASKKSKSIHAALMPRKLASNRAHMVPAVPHQKSQSTTNGTPSMRDSSLDNNAAPCTDEQRTLNKSPSSEPTNRATIEIRSRVTERPSQSKSSKLLHPTDQSLSAGENASTDSEIRRETPVDKETQIGATGSAVAKVHSAQNNSGQVTAKEVSGQDVAQDKVFLAPSCSHDSKSKPHPTVPGIATTFSGVEGKVSQCLSPVATPEWEPTSLPSITTSKPMISSSEMEEKESDGASQDASPDLPSTFLYTEAAQDKVKEGEPNSSDGERPSECVMENNFLKDLDISQQTLEMDWMVEITGLKEYSSEEMEEDQAECSSDASGRSVDRADDIGSVQCPDCGKIYTSPKAFQNHLITSNGVDHCTLKCSFTDCGVVSSSKYAAKLHMKREHKAKNADTPAGILET